MTTKRSETPEPAVPRPPTFSRKDLLDIESITEDDIRLVLDTAESMREINQRSIKKVPALRGKLVANLFFENSTRTRFSFEIAERRLSADSIAFTAAGVACRLAVAEIDKEHRAPFVDELRGSASDDRFKVVRMCTEGNDVILPWTVHGSPSGRLLT